MKAVVAAFNQEKALVGAFSVITNLRMELFEALVHILAPLLPRPCEPAAKFTQGHPQLSGDLLRPPLGTENSPVNKFKYL